jgi:hypothetical protein
MKFVRICGHLRKILLGYENLVPEPDVMSGRTGIETDGDRTVGALQSQRPPDSRLGVRVGRPHNQTAGGCHLPRSAQRRWPCRAGVAGVASRRWLHGVYVPVPDRYRLFRAWLETGRQHWSNTAAARWLCASVHRTVRCERCGQSSRLQHGRAVRQVACFAQTGARPPGHYSLQSCSGTGEEFLVADGTVAPPVAGHRFGRTGGGNHEAIAGAGNVFLQP